MAIQSYNSELQKLHFFYFAPYASFFRNKLKIT